MEMKSSRSSIVCELCNDGASVYCPSDSAYLCNTCDFKVHNANFLVARHIRTLICNRCWNLDGNRFSGAVSSSLVRKPCRYCSPEKISDEVETISLSSSSSSCVSSTTEAGEEAVSKRRATRKGKRRTAAVMVDIKVEGVLVNWCRRIGGGIMDDKKSLKVISTTVELLGGCMEKMTILPFRISLATTFWVALRLVGGRTTVDVRRVERISGVPARLILATESRIARTIRRRSSSSKNQQEGWAEC